MIDRHWGGGGDYWGCYLHMSLPALRCSDFKITLMAALQLFLVHCQGYLFKPAIVIMISASIKRPFYYQLALLYPCN